MNEYRKYTDPMVLTREQCDWAFESLFPKHAGLTCSELSYLATALDHASRGMSGPHWWDRERREFLFRGPSYTRTSDQAYIFFVDDELLHITDVGGWLGPCRLSFYQFPAQLEGRRGEFQARLAEVIKKAGLASALNEELWTDLKPEDQDYCQPQFVGDDQKSLDTL